MRALLLHGLVQRLGYGRAVGRVEAAAVDDRVHPRARLLGQRGDGVAWHAGDHHGAHVDGGAAQLCGPHTAADALARLEHSHLVRVRESG